MFSAAHLLLALPLSLNRPQQVPSAFVPCLFEFTHSINIPESEANLSALANPNTDPRFKEAVMFHTKQSLLRALDQIISAFDS